MTHVTREPAHQHPRVGVVMRARHPGGTPQRLEPDACEAWDWFDGQARPQPLFAPLFTPLASLRVMGWVPPHLQSAPFIQSWSPR